MSMFSIFKNKIFIDLSLRNFLLIFCALFCVTELYAAPATVTFQARIVKPDLTNLESSSVSFKFYYLYPKPGGTDLQCVIYAEEITGVNMTGSKGLVTLQLGSGTRTYGSGNLKNVFDNSTASYPCQAGGTYTPGANDNRRVIVQFNDGTGTQTLPPSELSAVPFSMQSYNSQRLGNSLATDFLKFIDFTGSCGAGEYLKYDSTASPKFSCAIPTGTGAGIVMSVSPGTGPLLVGGTAADPTISIPQATVSTDGYLSSADFTTFNSKLSVATLLSSDITTKLGFTPAANNDSRFTDQRIPTNGSVTAAKIASGAVTFDKLNQSSATTGQVIKWDGSAWVASSDITVAGSVASVTSGGAPIIVGGTATNPTISLAKATSSVDGYLSSADFTTFNSKLSDFSTLASSDITGKLGYTPVNPSTLGTAALLNTNQVVLVSNLPANCNAGQTLTFSSPTGSWVCSNIVLSNSTVTNSMVTSLDWTKVVNTPTTAVGYGIPQASLAIDGYLSSADFTTFNSKLSNFSTLSSSDITGKLGYIPANATSAWSLNASGDVSRMSGNVGIGTTTPSAKLDVIGNMGLTGTIYNPSSGDTSSVGIAADTAANTTTAGIRAWGTLHDTYPGDLHIISKNSGGIKFYNYNSGWTEQMRVSSNGNVGIGTTSPEAALQVGGISGSSSPAKIFVGNYSTDATGDAQILGNWSSTGLWGIGVADNSTATVKLGVVDYPSMEWSASQLNFVIGGNVGIGATAPVNSLEVVRSAVDSNYVAKFNGNNSNNYGVLVNITNTSSNRNILQLQSAGSDKMVVRGDGSIGIGNTAPRATLDVSGPIISRASQSFAAGTIDFSASNLRHTTQNCGAFALHNLKDGGTYMFAVQGTTVATCSFTAFSDAGSTALTVHLPPDHGATTTGKHTIYNIAVMGTHAYIAWTPGY